MKKTFKTLFSLMLTLVVVFGLTVTAFADGTVIYVGDEESFTFSEGSEYSPTDLFDSFKNLMPGDKLSQKVVVVNDGKEGYTTKIYMKALGPTDIEDGTEVGNGEDTDGFENKTVYQKVLSQLQLTVVVDDGRELFDATADQVDGLYDWVLLESLRPGEEVTLDLTLTVPLEMGNEFQDVAGYLDWAFKVEEIKDPEPTPTPTPTPEPTPEPTPTPTPVPVTPDTGDISNTLFYAVMFAISAAALIVIFLFRKRKTEEE